MVEDTVTYDVITQTTPIILVGDMDAPPCEQRRDPFGLRRQRALAVRVFVEIIAFADRLRVGGAFEAGETRAAFDGERVRRPVGVVGDGHEVHVGEVEGLRGAVHDGFPGEESVEVHLAQSDGVSFAVGPSDGGDAGDVRVFRNGGERTYRPFHRAPQSAVHGLGDIEGSEVAGDVATHVGV